MAELPESLAPAANAHLDRASILLVDDNPANPVVLRAMLEDADCDILEAHSGEEALERLKDQEFAVVLLDLRLPGLSSFDTAKLIREDRRSRHTPIIFLTAEEIDRVQVEAAYALGAVDFFIEPLSPVVVQAKVRGFVALFREKERVKQEAEQFRLIIQGTTDYAIFMLDTQGRVVTWNGGAERLKGYRADEIIGQHFSKFYPQDVIDRGWPAYELKMATAEGRFEDEGWRLRKDGSRIWANIVITALRDEKGQLRGFSKVTRDLTARKQAEENARKLAEETAARQVINEERERLHVTLASIGDAVISTDGQGNVEFLNPMAEELIGWRSADAAGRSLVDVFHIINEKTRKPVENPALRALREGRTVGLENHTVLISRDGSEHPIDDSAAPIRNNAGEISGSVLVFRDISEQRRAEVALRESEEKLRLLADTIPQLAWMAKPNGDIFWYNRRWYEYTGTTAVQMEGWGWQSVHDPEVLPQVVQRWKHSLETGEPFDMVFPLRGADGVLRPFLTRVNPLKAGDGRILYWFGTNTDVTELRQALVALADSEERLRLALEAGRMGVWDWNVRTGELNWSDSLEPLHGLAPGTFGGTFEHFLQLVHPDDRQAVQSAIRTALDSGGEFYVEFRNLRQNGSIHWIAGSGKVFCDDDGQPLRMIGIGLDVTQRKRAEQTARFLADASAALAVLVDFDSTLQKLASLAVPYFADWASVDVLEESGNLRRVAVAHVEPAKVQLAHELHRRFPSQANAPTQVWNILRTGQPEIVPVITDDMLVAAIQDEDLLHIIRELGLRSYIGVPLTVRGKTIGVLTFIVAESDHVYDHTDLAVAKDLAGRAAIAVENTQLYRELQDADRRKDEFLATLAHELRNPLAPIRNGLQVLRLAGGGGGIVDDARSMMERQLAHMVRLVDDLLDVSRITRNKLELRKEKVSLATVIHTAVETSRPLIEQSGHTFSLTLTPTPVYLDADPVRLAQVFSNLLNNAAKYTEPGGRITLTAESQGNQAVVRIRDNGLGIPTEAQPGIFKMFSQVDRNMERAQGGLGIGLTLVRRLTEMHGGTVNVQSEGAGKGSEFTIRIPVLKEDRQHSAGQTTDCLVETAGTKRRILVVDDNKDAAESLGMMLRLMGNEVRTAHDGLAAVEAAEAYRPEIILLDIGLPKLNGYEACRNIRELEWSKGVTIVALTGWGQEDDRRRSQQAGFDHHLVKPVEIAALQKLLAEHQGTEGT